ncbi:MAG: tRNA pseudouridine(38-40) synthase TruA [Clostridiales bacterium]|nr:tRNA pseudouridine(38-40) synthase TruA [Clostridiales bacterium]
MQNYRMVLAYDGSRYQGWQSQGNTQNTIQTRVEAALSRLTGETVEVSASGRTDAGVHAAGQVVSFRLEQATDCAALLEALNRYLPEDIGVLSLDPAEPRFHARLSARGKVYVYRIWNSPSPDVFGRKYRYALPQPLDLERMEAAARLLEGQHDFRSFCGLTRYKKSTVRTVSHISVTRSGPVVELRFRGDGFLNRMVRILAGTLVEVGLGLREPDSMTAVLAARDRSAAAGALPPHGLMLETVFYGAK